MRWGTKVFLRPVGDDDAPTIAGWLEDEELARAVRAPAAEPSAYCEQVARSERDLALGIRLVGAGERLVGLAVLQDVDLQRRSAQLGVLVGERTDWGKGYGTEATSLMVGFGFEMGLSRIWLEVLAANQRAQRAYEKAGFELEPGSPSPASLVMAVRRERWPK